MDDGAKDAETALGMVMLMKEQGVERIVATPHFYSHEERSLTEYLIRRQYAWESIAELEAPPETVLPEILLGAEVAVEHGISKIHGINRLAIEDTDMILLELPFRDLEDWMTEEIENIASEYGLRVVLAHVHRYLEYYSQENIEKLLDTDAVFQFNNEAFLVPEYKALLDRLTGEKKRIVFGSDAHNLACRRPNWDMLREKCGEELLRASDEMLGISEETALPL
jgi:protein-tyrosine phosphatase